MRWSARSANRGAAKSCAAAGPTGSSAVSASREGRCVTRRSLSTAAMTSVPVCYGRSSATWRSAWGKVVEMVNPTYTVQYEHDDNGDWLVTVPDVPSAHTFGRTLSHAREMAREVIALVLDVEPDAFGIRDEVLLGAPADRLIREAREARARAEVATAEA